MIQFLRPALTIPSLSRTISRRSWLAFADCSGSDNAEQFEGGIFGEAVYSLTHCHQGVRHLVVANLKVFTVFFLLPATGSGDRCAFSLLARLRISSASLAMNL